MRRSLGLTPAACPDLRHQARCSALIASCATALLNCRLGKVTMAGNRCLDYQCITMESFFSKPSTETWGAGRRTSINRPFGTTTHPPCISFTLRQAYPEAIKPIILEITPTEVIHDASVRPPRYPACGAGSPSNQALRACPPPHSSC